MGINYPMRWGQMETKPDVTTTMTPALRWAVMKAILNVSFILRDKVTWQCPQTKTFEERGETNRNRTNVFTTLTSLTGLIAKPNQLTSTIVGLGKFMSRGKNSRDSSR